MVGLSSDFQQVRAEDSSRKRRTTEDLVKEGNRKEVKKLRVEQVVTALSNTDKAKEYSRQRESNSPVTDGDETCVCGTSGIIDLGDTGQYYSRAFKPSTKVTFALGPKVNEEEHGMRGRTLLTNNNLPYFHHYLAPTPGLPIRRPFMQPENVPLPIVKGEGSGSEVILPTPPQSISFIPLLREHPVAGNAAGNYKHVDIIRVPRDDKTPFVVFKPEHHLRHPLGPPRFPGALTPNRSSVQNISLPTHMSPLPNEPLRNQPSDFQPGFLPRTLLRYPIPRHFRDGAANTQFDQQYDPLPRGSHSQNTQRWSAVLVSENERQETLSKQETRSVDSDDQEKDMLKYPDRLSAWSINNVYNYLKETDFSDYAEVFKSQEIDGKALRLLDEISMSRLLEVKMGPAIKLAALIKSLIDRLGD